MSLSVVCQKDMYTNTPTESETVVEMQIENNDTFFQLETVRTLLSRDS